MATSIDSGHLLSVTPERIDRNADSATPVSRAAASRSVAISLGVLDQARLLDDALGRCPGQRQSAGGDVRSSQSFLATVRWAASIPSFAGIVSPDSMSISASS